MQHSVKKTADDYYNQSIVVLNCDVKYPKQMFLQILLKFTKAVFDKLCFIINMFFEY